MIFVGFWRQVHSFSVYSNSLPKYFRPTCLFHSHNILVKSFTVFATNFAKFFWEKINVRLQKAGFQTHIASHSFVRCQQVLQNTLMVRGFVIS